MEIWKNIDRGKPKPLKKLKKAFVSWMKKSNGIRKMRESKGGMKNERKRSKTEEKRSEGMISRHIAVCVFANQ